MNMSVENATGTKGGFHFHALKFTTQTHMQSAGLLDNINQVVYPIAIRIEHNVVSHCIL